MFTNTWILHGNSPFWSPFCPLNNFFTSNCEGQGCCPKLFKLDPMNIVATANFPVFPLRVYNSYRYSIGTRYLHLLFLACYKTTTEADEWLIINYVWKIQKLYFSVLKYRYTHDGHGNQMHTYLPPTFCSFEQDLNQRPMNILVLRIFHLAKMLTLLENEHVVCRKSNIMPN